MTELIQFMHFADTETHDGGGDFLLILSDSSLKPSKRGPGKSPLYANVEGLDKKDAAKALKRKAEDRQRWYRGTSKQLPREVARFWRTHFHRDGFLNLIDTRINLDVKNDWHAIFEANGYACSRDQLSAMIADLFVTGLGHVAVGIPHIDDKPWNPDLIDATAAELAVEIQQKQRFSELKPTDIYVEGDVLVVGTYRVRMPAPPTVPIRVTNYERKYTDQLLKVLCTECGIDVSLRALQGHGSDYLEDFDTARQAYYLAEGLRELMKDSSLDGEDEFERIKDETFSGVRPVYRKRHPSGYEKMLDTLAQAAKIQLTNSQVPAVTRLFQVEHRHGITHMLVNDERLTWVKDEE